MEYLTVHDLVWINSAITGSANRYNYFMLEAVIAAQYSYGKIVDAQVQSGTILERLLADAPFTTGNQRTALIAALTFLDANGYSIKVTDEDAARIIHAVISKQKSPYEAARELSAPTNSPLPNGMTLRKLITHECNHHMAALKLLASGD